MGEVREGSIILFGLSNRSQNPYLDLPSFPVSGLLSSTALAILTKEKRDRKREREREREERERERERERQPFGSLVSTDF